MSAGKTLQGSPVKRTLPEAVQRMHQATDLTEVCWIQLLKEGMDL